MANFKAFHLRILAIHVLQDIRMDQQVIEAGVENGPLVGSATLDLYSRQVVVPLRAGSGLDLFEVEAGYLVVHVLASVFYADIRDTQLDLNALALFGVVVEPDADVIAAHLTGIFLIDLVFARVDIPFSLDAFHFPLLFPVTHLFGRLAYFHDKIDGEDRLRIVAESTEQLASLDLRIIDDTYRRACLIR